MKAWLYYRLSRDEDAEMNSLQNQRQILVDYAEQHGYEISGESFDDNVSGMTFERKGLHQIELAVEDGKVDVLLVKDLSRLGRHRTRTALFIEYLRENNVKVYSVTEGIDSSNENDDMIIGFKQLVNDFYAKDIGKKVRTGIRQKQKTGMTVNLPMGYYKDRNTGEVLVDETAAAIVREIFEKFFAGYGLSTIAKDFNRRGIKSPEFFSHRKKNPRHTEVARKFLWVQTSVKRIIQNEAYTGTLVNHKTVTSKIYKTVDVIPPEEQYRHENFMPAIIDRETFDQAQVLLESRLRSGVRAKFGSTIHRYCGMIKCAECGANFIAKKRTVAGKSWVEYTCNSNWVLYTINCSIDSEIKIGEKTLRFTNKDYTDVEYENEESNESNKYYYTVKDIKGNDVKCTKTHPIITIYTDRMYENGIVIHVNNEKIPLKVIKTNFEDAISVVYDQNFKNKESIFINLERIYNSANGLYEVYADIPSKSTSYLICRYICFPYDLVVKRNRKIYRADHELSVKIEQSMDFEIEFEPLFNCETSDNYYVNNMITKLYKANAIDVGDLVSFKFYSEGTELVMNIPVPKFKFGGSVEKMECRPVYNWYKDIPDNMYVYFLGALSMKITFEWDNKIYQADGNVIDTCTFRFDMKEINDLIKSINNRSYMHLDISYYDGKARNNSIMVQRQLKIEPYFNEESVTFNPIEKTLLININKILFKDRATLYAEIEDVVNKSIVYDGELKEGNNVISNIDSTRNYSIRPYMIEKNGLFGTVRTSMRWFFINGKKTISNISDYHITIRSIYNKGKRLQFFDYLYGIDFLTMSNDNDCVFFGRFYAAPYNQKRPDFKNKKIIGNIMMTINKNSLENERDPLCTIAMLETDYNEYVELYYDIERKMLISPNNKRLHSNNYGKFIPLYENETVFCLELRLRKERKDVIQTN